MSGLQLGTTLNTDAQDWSWNTILWNKNLPPIYSLFITAAAIAQLGPE